MYALPWNCAIERREARGVFDGGLPSGAASTLGLMCFVRKSLRGHRVDLGGVEGLLGMMRALAMAVTKPRCLPIIDRASSYPKQIKASIDCSEVKTMLASARHILKLLDRELIKACCHRDRFRAPPQPGR